MADIRLKPINQQVVVVFGASSGIGRATALQFAREGAKLVVSARNQDALESLAEEIRAFGGEAYVCPADAAIFGEVQSVADFAVRQFGRIDTWAHIAGVGIYGKFWELSPAEFDQAVQIDLMGPVYGAMASLPHLKAQKGAAFIAVSSVESQIGLPYQSAYAAAKHGMKGFLDVLRLELEYEDIPVSVTNIMPASVNTPFFSNATTKLGVQPRAVPPVYEPEQVANAIVKAAHEPQRDVIVGGAGYMFVWMKRLMPSLADRMLLHTAFKQQLTHKAKAENSPSNLFQNQTNDTRIRVDAAAKEPKAA